MEIFLTLKIIALFVLTAYLLWYYAAKDVSFRIKVVVFVSWFMTFAPIVLLPDDIYYTVTNDESPDVDSHYETYKLWWKAIYWTLFILAWIILPLIQEYVDSGAFTPKEKFKRSVKLNLIFYGVCGVLGIVFIIYLIITEQINSQNFFSVIKALANCFGVFLTIVLLGYGLVIIPRRALRKRDKNLILKFYQFKAAVNDEQRLSTAFELEDLIKMLTLIEKKHDVSQELKSLAQVVLSIVPQEVLDKSKRIGQESSKSSFWAQELGEVNLSKLVQLHTTVKRKTSELRRLECEWETILEGALFLEDVIKSSDSREKRIVSSIHPRKRSWFRPVDTIKWYWFTKIEPKLVFALGFVFAAFSIIVVVGEITIFQDYQLSLFGWAVREESSYLKTQLLCMIPLLYISICCYIGLFNLKFAGLYGLYPRHHTDSGSLIFAAMNFTRIAFGLVFNFLLLVRVKDTAFNASLGDVNLVPLVGISFQSFFPMTLIVLCLFNVFDVYGRILTGLGISRFEFSEKFSNEKIEDGKRLLHNARQKLMRECATSLDTESFGDISSEVNLKAYDSHGFELGATA